MPRPRYDANGVTLYPVPIRLLVAGILDADGPRGQQTLAVLLPLALSDAIPGVDPSNVGVARIRAVPWYGAGEAHSRSITSRRRLRQDLTPGGRNPVALECEIYIFALKEAPVSAAVVAAVQNGRVVQAMVRRGALGTSFYVLFAEGFRPGDTVALLPPGPVATTMPSPPKSKTPPLEEPLNAGLLGAGCALLFAAICVCIIVAILREKAKERESAKVLAIAGYAEPSPDEEEAKAFAAMASSIMDAVGEARIYVGSSADGLRSSSALTHTSWHWQTASEVPEALRVQKAAVHKLEETGKLTSRGEHAEVKYPAPLKLEYVPRLVSPRSPPKH